MKPNSRILLLSLLALLPGRTLAAADDPFAVEPKAAAAAPAPAPPPAPVAPAAPKTPDEQKRRPAEQLPAPLNGIACNLVEVEKSGFLEFTKVAFGRSEDFGDEALIWTAKVQRPITCRHAMILLRQFSDVRFYHSEEKLEKEVYSGELYYSPRIAEGAVHGEILRRDMEFEVWVLLDQTQVIKLQREQADTVVFHEPQTVRVPTPGVARTPWNMTGTSKIPRWFSAAKQSK